jgi:hypothetical protein
MDVRLRAVEFGGVWHWHVTEILLPRTEAQGPRGPPDLTQVSAHGGYHPVPSLTTRIKVRAMDHFSYQCAGGRLAVAAGLG